MQDRRAAANNPPDREPPRDFDAEQAVLGSSLLEPGAFARAIAICGPEDMYWEDHQCIYQAIVDCGNRNEPVDLVTVSSELRRIGKLDEVGGGTYLTALISQVPTAAHVVRYANIVAEKAVLRRLIEAGAAIEGLGYGNPEDVGGALAQAEESLRALQERASAGAMFSPADTYEADFEETQEHFESDRPMISEARTGIDKVDYLIGGLGIQRLAAIQAGEKYGKSQLLRQILLSSARRFQEAGDGRLGLFFGLEEPWESWRWPAWAWLAGADSKHMMIPGWWKNYLRLNPWAQKAVLKAQAELRKLPIKVAFGEHILPKILAHCRAQAHEHPIGIVVIDYFQLLSGGQSSGASTTEGFQARARALVGLGNDLGCPVVVGSQMTWNNDLKRFQPMGGRALMADGTIILELHRDHDKQTKQMLDTAELSCVWSRWVPGFRPVKVRTDRTCGRFWDDEGQWARVRTVPKERGGGGEAGNVPLAGGGAAAYTGQSEGPDPFGDG